MRSFFIETQMYFGDGSVSTVIVMELMDPLGLLRFARNSIGSGTTTGFATYPFH